MRTIAVLLTPRSARPRQPRARGRRARRRAGRSALRPRRRDPRSAVRRAEPARLPRRVARRPRRVAAAAGARRPARRRRRPRRSARRGRSAPDAVYLTADVSAYAQERERRLRAGGRGRSSAGLTVVDARRARARRAAITTASSRRTGAPGAGAARRALEPAPRIRVARRARCSGGSRSGPCAVGARPTPRRAARGRAARGCARWLDDGLARYGRAHDDLAADATSRLSPYLHFGCVSPLELARAAPAGERGVRPPALLARLLPRSSCSRIPETAARGLPRRAATAGATTPDALDAWQEGRTGYPIVDAGMRQLAREGWMHNRARLITASFLTKDLRRRLARSAPGTSSTCCVDGDVANNVGNWQWVAGTGVDTRPNRIFNPIAQAKRFDPDGRLRAPLRPRARRASPARDPRAVEARAADRLRELDYPEPIVDHREAVARFRSRRADNAGKEQLTLLDPR